MGKPQSRTAPDLLDEIAAREADRIFLIDGETRLTYREFREGVRACAKGFLAMGVRKGGLRVRSRWETTEC